MRAQVQKTTQLGDLVVAAFDEAAFYSSDPREVSRLATRVVGQMLWRAQRTALSPSLAVAGTAADDRWE